jgi:hypothetical protein
MKESDIEALALTFFRTANKHKIIFDLGWMKIFEAGYKAALSNSGADSVGWWEAWQTFTKSNKFVSAIEYVEYLQDNYTLIPKDKQPKQ